ncbi:MAG: member of Set1p complex, histone methyl transferase [Vezdaea aestivalis]|nr:MAG: member of Set1p complex, histone methyl transferase [Vezdaea aestivalis]
MDTDMTDAPPPPLPPPPPSKRPHPALEDAINAYRPVKIFRTEASPHLLSLDFDSSGNYLLTCTSDETLHIYDTQAGAHHKECFSKKYGAALGRFTHNSSDVLFASTKVDDSIRYLSTHTQAFHRYFKGHTAQVTSLCMSPGDDTFVSASLDNTVRLWDFRQERASGILNLSTPYLATFDPSASVMAIASPSTSSVLLYDKRQFDKEPFSTFELDEMEMKHAPRQPRNATWSSLEFSNDGACLLVGTSGEGHYLLNAFDGTLVGYLDRVARACRPAPGQEEWVGMGGKSQTVLGQGDACFSPDGRWVVSGLAGEGVLGWDVGLVADGPKAKPTFELPCKARAAVLRWNPRFHMLASGDREVVMWTPERGLLESVEDDGT